METQHKWEFVSSYMGESDYFNENGDRYHFRYRREEYRDGIWNYTPREFERQINGVLGCLFRGTQPIPTHVAQSFINHIRPTTTYRGPVRTAYWNCKKHGWVYSTVIDTL